jgi:hypothetical protein
MPLTERPTLSVWRARPRQMHTNDSHLVVYNHELAVYVHHEAPIVLTQHAAVVLAKGRSMRPRPCSSVSEAKEVEKVRRLNLETTSGDRFLNTLEHELHRELLEAEDALYRVCTPINRELQGCHVLPKHIRRDCTDISGNVLHQLHNTNMRTFHDFHLLWHCVE